MENPLFDKWRKRHGPARGVSVMGPAAVDEEGVAELLAECELLRTHASAAGIELDDTAASLEALDQLPPQWRDDPDNLSWLGNDAGLYLGTVIVRGVPGAVWQVWPNGHPVVRLASGREVDVVAAGHAWAVGGTPELAQVHAEAAEGH
ncbi:DUF6278 family protein [Streptantibioticus ferralitis]|uniref:DUF6278 family protein n=1 Tax=Streptantibioticus ferralitis TaxID=236510 RepID=A0ABT5ZB27_9ACTN|nr:DUF6278 family protein [Streptantibioticus ferralitis]MDF2261040.1 DUF6278 family protein [Streptantibioticus ferralitis]